MGRHTKFGIVSLASALIAVEHLELINMGVSFRQNELIFSNRTIHSALFY